MQIEPTILEGVYILRPQVFGDERGQFFEWFRKDKLAEFGISFDLVQANQSMSRQGTLRGLHFQRPPYGQSKMVRVIKGKIWDVAVDLRADSPTFGKWVGAELSDNNHASMLIPSAFAHGFFVMSEYAVVSYACDGVYTPEAEAGFRWNDPTLAIDWPAVDPKTVVLSARDKDW
ncbi:dTDP-4-dehydrorhamnose 3,5-epimerase, partial [bacterium]|nr:dTDP-4-dehydrorhamnose 3,5-epimerase [bacterium]